MEEIGSNYRLVLLSVLLCSPRCFCHKHSKPKLTLITFLTPAVFPYNSPTHSVKYFTNSQTQLLQRNSHVNTKVSWKQNVYHTPTTSTFWPFVPLYLPPALPTSQWVTALRKENTERSLHTVRLQSFYLFQICLQRGRWKVLKNCLSYLCFCFLLRSSWATEAQVSASFTASRSLRKRSFSGYFLSSASSSITLSSITSATRAHK